jgi:hypothetical protein
VGRRSCVNARPPANGRAFWIHIYVACILSHVNLSHQSIDHCFEWFSSHDLSERSSILPWSLPFVRPSYYERRKTEHFRSLFIDLLKNSSLGNIDETSSLFDDNLNSTSKTVVLASDAKSGRAIALRSYVTDRDGRSDIQGCSILEAALAAISMPLESEAVEIRNVSATEPRDMSLMSASIAGYSNPSKEVLYEAIQIWKGVENIKILLSLGSGSRAPLSSTDLNG